MHSYSLRMEVELFFEAGFCVCPIVLSCSALIRPSFPSSKENFVLVFRFPLPIPYWPSAKHFFFSNFAIYLQSVTIHSDTFSKWRVGKRGRVDECSVAPLRNKRVKTVCGSREKRVQTKEKYKLRLTTKAYKLSYNSLKLHHKSRMKMFATLDKAKPYRKYKRLKLGGGHVYECSSV
jgi:hypothetical protein